jgi:cytochrome c oxidase subunit 2
MLNELLRRALFLPPQASTVAKQIDGLHFFVIVTTMLGAAAITLAGLIMLVRYRARDDRFRPEDPAARTPKWLEVGVVGGLLSLFTLWWVIGFFQYLRIEVPPPGSLTIYVTAKQWMWKFAYPDGQRTIATLYVPAGQPVRLVLSARDVIHSFYVPAFRIKQDAVPGRSTTAWFEVKAPGVYPIFCAEYCGVGHSTMHGEVIALSAGDYARWLAAGRVNAEVDRAGAVVAGATEPGGAGLAGPRDLSPLPVDQFAPPQPLSLVRVGVQAAADLGCLRCHSLDGTRHIGPTWVGLYGASIPLEGGGTIVADDAYLTESMMDPAARLHAGYPPVMPSYHALMQPAQVGAILELLRAIRAGGTVAQPEPRLPIRVETEVSPAPASGWRGSP